MDRIMRLVSEFRNAMNCANDAGIFNHVLGFEHFPLGSCGETCYLLAQYLLEHDIFTEYVCGRKWPQSHAWLVVADKEALKNKRIIAHKDKIARQYEESTNEYGHILQIVTNPGIVDIEYSIPDYKTELEGRTIIDITGDQFSNCQEFLNYNIQVYVGPMDTMHSLFEIDNIHECNGLDGVGPFNLHRLYFLYREIKKYL